jgi:uncharacterized protein DUF6065
MAAVRAAARAADAELREFVAFRIGPGMEIRCAPRERAWMQTPAGTFAKRCLPLLMADQSGWELLNPAGFTAMWDGSADINGIRILPHSTSVRSPVISHFGSGILTWHVPYLFRTPAGYNLLVRGPANMPKDGIGPLEGIVETDWTTASFTMNWKFTRAGYPIVFEAGEAIAMLVPMRRGELESFRPVVREAASDQSLLTRFQLFATSRQHFNQALQTPGSAAARTGWQRDYMLGRNTDGSVAEEHQTRLQIPAFELQL